MSAVSTPASAALPYVTLVPYPTDSNLPVTGGDSLKDNLNIYYETGNIAWMLISTALVFLMVPGVGFFYSGLARRKSALSLLWLSVMGTAVVSFQWFFWGYSLAFSHKAGKFMGALDNFALMGVLAQPSVASPLIPDLLFCVYQGMFACITVVIAIGAVAERGRMLPALIYMFVWTTVIYDAIACWTWNPHGWVFIMGGLDFAGGTPVHIASGCAALAYSYMLGKRRGHGTQELNYRPHNVTHIVIGTVFLWVGWFGFNAGSALGANMRAVMAAVVTNLAAGCGGITWCLVDYRLERKWSTVGFCSGVIAGLVAITPGSGYVPPWSAVVYGVVGGAACNYATKLKYFLRCDDALDIFAVHAVGGFVGNILTAFFAADYIASLDGINHIPGGWLNHHWIQLGYQLADSVSGGAYSFFGTCLILAILDFVGKYVPVFKLRASEEEEILGIDDVEIGEFAYDYVELSREVKALDDMDDQSSHVHSTNGHYSGEPKSYDSSRPLASLEPVDGASSNTNTNANNHERRASLYARPLYPRTSSEAKTNELMRSSSRFEDKSVPIAMASAAHTNRVPFPSSVEEFSADPRVSFSRQDGKYILEDHDGSEWEWEESLEKWTAAVDEKLLEQQQQAYAVAGVDESESAEASIKKRKQEDNANSGGNKKPKKEKKERVNTAVYVTSLPLDVTVEEVHDVFSKYGIIAEEVDSGKPRIKLYTDDAGIPKGDALVVYFRPESVALAVQMLDDYDFRLGETGPDGKMRVKAADYSYKKQQDAPGKQVNMKDKKKVIKKTQKLNNKLADWDEDDPQPQSTVASRWDKMVILKHMFTQDELKDDPDAKQEITDDIKEECGKLGTVANVTLFDEEADGVVSVRFSTTEAADACVELMNGRHFGGQKVIAEIADGTEKFRKSRNTKKVDKDAEEERRLNEFGEWLERDDEE